MTIFGKQNGYKKVKERMLGVVRLTHPGHGNASVSAWRVGYSKSWTLVIEMSHSHSQ